jgi:hypothetical protein
MSKLFPFSVISDRLSVCLVSQDLVNGVEGLRKHEFRWSIESVEILGCYVKPKY